MNSKIFGEKIAALRKAKGLTQARLAEILNVSNKTISRWETGEGYPEITLLAPLAKALGVSVDQLLSDDESGEEDGGPNPQSSAEKKREFFNFSAKEYKHKDIPVRWPGLPIKKFSFNKTNLILNVMQLVYLAVFTFILIDASVHFQYTEMAYNSGIGNQYLGDYGSGDFFLRSSGYTWLIAMAVSFILLVIINLVCLKKEKLPPLITARNIGITTVLTLVSILFGFSYHTGKHGFYSNIGIVYEKIYEYKPGNILNCDFIKIEPVVIAICGIAACSILILTELIRAIISYRRKKNEQTEPVVKERGLYTEFWRSLTIFNKIGLVCILVNIVIIIVSLLLIIPTGYLTVMSVLLIIPSNIAKAGLLVGIIGLVLGLSDIYDRQNKCSIILIVINLIMVYVLPITMVILTMLLGMTYTGVYDVIMNTDIVEQIIS